VTSAWTRQEFEERLRDKGRAYHIHHPFNVMLNSGAANREQIRGWVANRYYYQINIPIKDGAILANCPDREVRRNWVQRILDHDGYGDDPGGIESWLRKKLNHVAIGSRGLPPDGSTAPATPSCRQETGGRSSKSSGTPSRTYRSTGKLR